MYMCICTCILYIHIYNFIHVYVYIMSTSLYISMQMQLLPRMGGGIAMCFIQKGVPVVLKDAKQDRDKVNTGRDAA